MKKFLLSIFAVMLAVFSVQAEEVTLEYSSVVDQGKSGGGAGFETIVAPVNFNFSNAYGNSGHIKAYDGCKITLSGATITKVVITATSSNYIKTWSASEGNITVSGLTATWTGNSTELELTNTATSQARIKTITVTYEEQGGVAQPKFSVAAGSYSASFDLELNADGNDIYYTLDGTEPDENSTEYTEAIPVKASVLVKAIAVDVNGEASSVAEANYEMVFNTASGKYVKATNLTDWTGNYLLVSEDYNVAFDGSLTAIDATGNFISVEIENETISATEAIRAASFNIEKVDGGYSILSSSGLYIGRNGTSNGMDESKTNVHVNVIENGTVKNTDGVKLQYYATKNSERFRYYASEQKPVVLYQYVASDYTLSVSAAGWATLCLNYDAEIPTGVTCYAVSAVDGEWATLAPVERVIPANTGVIVEANEGSYTFEVATEEGSDVANELIGTTVNTYITKEAYVLGIVDGVVGLYKAQMAGGVWLNNANKAYLPASVANGAASYSFRFGEGTTGVEKVEIRNEKSEIYDLTGRRVEATNMLAASLVMNSDKSVDTSNGGQLGGERRGSWGDLWQ